MRKMFGIFNLKSGEYSSSDDENLELCAFTYRSYASDLVAIPKDYINRGEQTQQDRPPRAPASDEVR